VFVPMIQARVYLSDAEDALHLLRLLPLLGALPVAVGAGRDFKGRVLPGTGTAK